MRSYKHILVVYSLLFLLLSSPVNALEGEIDFKDFELIGKPPTYHVQTRVEFKLTDYLQKALLSGISLNARVQFRLGQHRSWWFNKDTPLLTIHYQLKYHALSRHFLLTRNDTNQHWNFSSLPASLRKLNELRRYKLPDIKASLNDGDYYVFAIADLVPETLVLPLRVQSLFSDKYKLTSEGILWPLP